MKAFFNTESYTVEKTKHHLTEHGKQKLLGVALILLGCVACIMFPEDGTAGLLAILLGLARTLVD